MGDLLESQHSAQNGTPSSDAYDFSLVLGGPLFQLLLRSHLCDDALAWLHRRLIVITMLAWAPLLVLSVLHGRAWGGGVRVPFLLDIEVHLRLLVVLPLLIGAELMVHQRLRGIVRQFVARGLIAEESRARLDNAIPSALRLRNSVIAEVLLIAVVYLVGVLYIWPHYVALNVPTWYADPVAGGHHLSPAGWWFVFVSLPVFQFILLRWYFRLLVWLRLVWQIARCKLSLVPTHPDHAGGLGFLSLTPVALAPILAAHGVALAGMIANQIFFHGAKLTDFSAEVGVIVLLLLLVALAPLLLFAPQLALAKRTGLLEYGTLAQRYVREFDNKWLRSGAPTREPLMGSPDIQSLADFSNSFEIIRSMKLVPITRESLVQLAALTLLPVAPLLLTMVSLEELVKRLIKVVL